LSEYYEFPAGHGKGRSWQDILIHWNAIEADFQDMGIDFGSGVLCERSWFWFTTRISGLLSKPPVVAKLGDGKYHEIPQTRLGMALNPPSTE